MQGHFEAIQEITRGARFSVFRAHRTGEADLVIKQAHVGRPELRSAERLRHEFEILRGLEAPSVSIPLDFATFQGSPALVLEDAGAHNLAELLNHHPLSIDAFLGFAVQMARVIDGIHKRSVIHRDICPENFVVDESGARITLVDFDAATVVPAFTERPGVPGELEGTLAYMAPEQTGRMKRFVDLRADLYALGATFYQMLTWQPPFPTLDPLELLHAHAARAPYPPAIVNRDVPAVLSDIVVKLLAKMPEWRYQTAGALVADLEEARRQHRGRGEIVHFELGRGDVPHGLFLQTEKLYGRDTESRLLAETLERASAEGTEVVLVSGPAGIGKSSLVNGIRERTLRNGRWITGRGDLLRSNVPYAPLIDAFSELVRELVNGPVNHVATMRERIQRATAPNGGVLIDAIPELRTLLGDQPTIETIGIVESEHRFQLVFAAFVRALLADGPPVVLFLDDLQWVDPASLKLMRTIAVDPDLRSLLILCACRSEELYPQHPIIRALDSIRMGGARITRVELKQLDSDALQAFLCDALRAQPAEVGPLADVVHRKTGSNPFFVRQLLGYLHRERLLVFDAERARWTWDLARIEETEVTPNVVHILASLIETLPQETRRALRAAACVGSQFELSLLAQLLEQNMDGAARALWAPVQQGLLVPVVEGPRFPWMVEKTVELGTATTPSFRFVHDRVQEAAYQSLSEDARQSLHRRIGGWLEQKVPEPALDDALYLIVDQYNRSTGQLPEAERIRLASLNARAGRLARHKGALASALGYFQSGLDLLPAEPWRHELRGLWFPLLRDAAECAGVLGDLSRSEALVNEGLVRTDAVLEKAELYDVSVRTNAFHGSHSQAIRRGRDGLAALHADLPREISDELISAERRGVQSRLHLRSDSQLLGAPPLDDPADKAKLQLLVDLSSTWFLQPDLFQLVACRAVALTAAKGLAPGSAVAYSYYAIASAMAHDYDEGYRYGRLAVQLAERLSSPTEACRALLLLAGHVSPWRAPISESVPMLQRSYLLALASGDLEFAAYALANLVAVQLFSGTELNRVLVEAESTIAFYRRAHHLSGLPYVQPFVQAARCMRGMTRGAFTFDDDRYEEARYRIEAADSGLGQAVFHALKLQACYLMGNPELAWKYASEARPWIPFLRTLILQVDFHFYAGLTATQIGQRGSSERRRPHLAHAREHLDALETWSYSAPMNFRHKRDLLAAELARIEDRPSAALALYHDAIEQARRGGFAQDEALGHELCGRFHRMRNHYRMGDLHLAAALDAYSQWGASAKVERLEAEFPSLALRGRMRHVTPPSTPPALDYLSLIKVSEALTEELVFERFLLKLVRTCGEAANAERTVLALDEGGLVERATATAGGEASIERRRIDEARSAPMPVMDHVFRSREVLVLGDAAHEGPFIADPYISAHRVRSVLAVPIMRGEKAFGVLYFENNLTNDAFTSERAAMFRLLSAQISIALENSRLFEARRRSEAALRLLSDTSAQLVETLDYAEVLSRIGRIIVPTLADWCVVDALDDGALRPIASAHKDPDLVTQVEELHRCPMDASSSQPQGQVLRSKKPLLIAEVTDETVRTGSRDEDHLRLLRTLEPRSAMFIPLTARERTIGTVTFVSSNPARRYDEADLALAEEVVRRFGLALDNARLYRDLRLALREREERDRYLRMLFRQMPGAVWAVDPSLKVTYATGRFFNVDARTLKGITVYEVLGTRDPTDAAIAHHFAALSGRSESFEYKFRDRWYAILIDPLTDQDQQIVGCVGAAFDITEKREIAERLATSERRLQEAQRVAHVGSFEWDIQPNALTWSDELQRIYGFEPGEFGGTFEAFMERVPADEGAETRRIIFDSYARLVPFTYDHRIVRMDGSVRVLHSRGDVIKDDQGKPIRMVGTCWDVTEQKELFQKLEHAVSRWEATVNATAEGILVVDQEGNLSSANKRFLSLWQIPGPVVEGVHQLQLLSESLDRLEDRDGFLDRIRDIYAAKDQESFDVIRFKDGRVFERYSTPQRIGGDITGRVWSIRDVTERERLLRRALFLADATRLLASLDVEQALDGVAHLAVPCLGDGCAIDLFGDGGPRRLIALSRDPRRPISSEVHPTALAGNSVTYQVGALSYLGAPLLLKGHVIGVITLAAGPLRRYTSTDLELAEELARRAGLAIDNARLYRRAQEALRARDEFLSIAAHEIRGPIHAIHMAIQSIRQSKVSPSSVPRLLEIVEHQDHRLSQFVDELLDLGRFRAGRLQIEFEPVNLGDVVREVAVRIGPDAAVSGSTLTISARSQIVGQWDKSRLDQVVFNLLSNAIKFGLGRPIEITIDGGRENALLIVTDHGMGMEPDVKARVFQPFERGVSERHFGGLGLGLYIVKMIVDALGGSIVVESQPGVGSTFAIQLPLTQVGAERHAHLDS